MEFRILGPLEVLDGDRTLELGGQRQRGLLALLPRRRTPRICAGGSTGWREGFPRAAVTGMPRPRKPDLGPDLAVDLSPAETTKTPLTQGFVESG
jgi:hypothetical protein